MSGEMEIEDYYAQCRAECASLREQLDNMVALLCQKDRTISELQSLYNRTVERLNRMTAALDDALGIVRKYRAERHMDLQEGCEL